MPIPDDFERECLYTQDAWFLHDVLELTTEKVVALVDTTRLGSLVESQNVLVGHPKHVPAAVMVNLTGTLGNLHAVYALGCRISEGWIGFGTNVRSARFPSIGKIGPSFTATMEVPRVRTFRGRKFVEYRFSYEQEGRVIYHSEQAAIWAPGHLVEQGIF